MSLRFTFVLRVCSKLKVKIQAHFKDFQGPKLHFSSTKIIEKKNHILDVDIQK